MYETLGNISLDILGQRAFKNVYGLYGLKHYIVEISGDVTDAGQPNDERRKNKGRFSYSANGLLEAESRNFESWSKL